MKYKKYTMDNALSTIIDYRGKTPKKSKTGIPTLSSKSVKKNYIDYSNCYYISKEEYNRFMIRGFPAKGDILLTTEAPMGMAAKLDREDVGIAQRLLVLRGKENILDNNYLLYWLQSPQGQSLLLSRETGTTVTGIKQSEFRKLEIYLPDIEYQQKASEILRLIDEKIQLNKKINDNLEKQLDVLYEIALADSAKLQKFSLGDICAPKQWKTLSKMQLDSLGAIDVYGAGGIIGKAHLPNHRERVLGVVCRGAGCGNLMMIEPPSYVTGNVMCLDNVSIFMGLASLYMSIKKRGLDDIISGSAQPQIVGSAIKAIQLEIPDKIQNTVFNNIATNIFNLIAQFKIENKSLEVIRETLLPKLMSGEIDVSAIEV